MTQPLVYVIVLNYNGRRWLENCFEALLRTEYENYQTFLVDNASTDDSVELFRNRFPQVEIISNHSNLGFSEGNNVGVCEALNRGADYVVLLNPDTKVEPDWLRELIAVGEAEDSIGILGAVQLQYDGMEFNSWTAAAARTHLAELSELASARRWILMEWVEGACFAVKRRVWEEVGLLDPIYFAFYEEIDLCRRALCRGYEVALVPRSQVHHHRGGSWEADERIKRERDYRCDRSQFIYASTDPRRSMASNMYWYLVTLGSKLKLLAKNFSLDRAVDLLRMQIELLRSASAIAGKWRGGD